MESAYTLANRELARRREENQAEQARRTEQVREAAPAYAQLEARLRQGGAALARCVLDGGKNYPRIEAAIRGLQAQKAGILRQLNLPEDYLDEIYSCEKCHDTGYDDRGARCSCLRQLVTKYIGVNANLTEYMKEQTFDRVDYSLFADQPAENGRQPLVYAKQAYARGLQFAETFDATHDNLLLMGNAGTGKTYLSSCIANYALARGKTVYYQTAFQLFDLLEKLKFGRYDGDDLEQAEYTSRYVYQTDLLIIDDLGTEFISAYSTAALFDIINTRQIQEKSTILSTNLTAAGLEQIYSKRLTSRLMGNYTVLPFVGRDLRMRKFQSPNK